MLIHKAEICMSLLLVGLSIVYTELSVTVSTQAGYIRGYKISTNKTGFSVKVFLGIPYAEPPVGNLRFLKPEEKNSWMPEVLNATKLGPSCPQRKSFLRRYSFGDLYDDFSEDCLFLNVYSPQNDTDPDAKYPVMVWIHGGAYTYGSGGEYDGRVLCQKGVVVVTVNYRLGVLGFLSMDDAIAPGNQGFLDQILALTWVKKNIASFGGDPEKVTIFGQSAGGGSVSLHMFTALSRGLFRSVIPQSGCALSPWSIYRPPFSIRSATVELANIFHCRTSSSAELIKCLRSKPAEDLVMPHITGPPMIAAFAPRVDGYVFHDLPENLLRTGRFNKNVTVMTGFVRNESADEVPTSFDNGVIGFTKHHYRQLIASWSSRFQHSSAVEQAVLCEYRGNKTDLEHYVSLYMEFKSDYGYVIPHIVLAESLTQEGVTTTLYEFDYRSENYPEPQWMGIIHAAELYYLFGSPFFHSLPCPGEASKTCPQTWYNYQKWTNTDKLVSENVMTMWTDFSKGHIRFRLDTAFTPSQQQYIHIGSSITVRSHPKSSRLPFWRKINYLDNNVNPVNSCHNPSGVFG